MAFRGVLLVVATLVVLLATIGGVVGLGYRHLAASRQAADAAWTPPEKPAPLAPATAPGADPAEMVPDTQPEAPESSIDLLAKDAKLRGAARIEQGKTGRENRKPLAPPKNAKEAARRRQRELMAGGVAAVYLTALNTPDDGAEWNVQIPKAGAYEVELIYACAKSTHSDSLLIHIADKELSAHLEPTRTVTNFRLVSIGSAPLPAGAATLSLSPAEGHTAVNIRGVRLIAAEQPN